jgi:hypothetical protein
MLESALKIKTGLAPYADGSGYKVEVTIEQDGHGAEPMLSIEAVYRLPASEWPAVARRIEHLLDAVSGDGQNG